MEEEKTQFRLLYRHFLFRLMDVELLSNSAGGDSTGLLGRLGSILVFGSVGLLWGAMMMGQEIARHHRAAEVWGAEHFLVAITMLAVGVFALLNWEATFPELRDVLVLGPMPVRVRTVFAAKIAAGASAMGLVIAGLHCLGGFAWPLVFWSAGPGSNGLRVFAAYWVSLAAAAAFVYCSVLGVQGILAQLPRRWYLRVSGLAQMFGLALFLVVITIEPSGAQHRADANWLPPYWFFALMSELSGEFPAQSHALMGPLAQRALAGLAGAVLAAAGAFLLCYLRTMKKMVEEPDLPPGVRGGLWLPRMGTQPRTAMTHFVMRTLVRSRQHRTIVAFYLGGGLALSAVYLGGVRQMLHASWIDLLQRVDGPVMVVSVLILCAAWMGTRAVFSLPLDLRANWQFRVTPPVPCRDCLAATRRGLLALSVMPVAVVSAAELGWFRSWQTAAAHCLMLLLLGSVLVDLSLREFHKLPFTCSYLPGKSNIHLMFWFGVIPLVGAAQYAVGWELRVIRTAADYAVAAAILIAAAVAARAAANLSARIGEPEIQFEEKEDGIITLGLAGG